MSNKKLLVLLPIFTFLVILIALTAVSCKGQEKPDLPQTTEVTQEQPERPALPTMLELGSEGCIPCEKMKPVMAQLTEEHGDFIHIEFHDVRKNQAIAQQYGIRLIPTQIFLKADGTEFFRHEGFFPKEDIEKVFQDMGVTF